MRHQPNNIGLTNFLSPYGCFEIMYLTQWYHQGLCIDFGMLNYNTTWENECKIMIGWPLSLAQSDIHTFISPYIWLEWPVKKMTPLNVTVYRLQKTKLKHSMNEKYTSIWSSCITTGIDCQHVGKWKETDDWPFSTWAIWSNCVIRDFVLAARSSIKIQHREWKQTDGWMLN